MSELINTHDNRATIRWKLLTGASALALATYVSSADLAKAEDTSQPQIWLELDGGFTQLDNSLEPFQPDFTLVTPRKSFITEGITGIQKNARATFDGHAQISFEPSGSDWTFSAGIRYGRDSRNKSSNQQSATPTNIYRIAYAYQNAAAQSSESHLMLDFHASKDVGLGLFGHGGNSAIGVGIRYAQLTARNAINIQYNPTNSLRHFNHYYASAALVHKFAGIGPSIAWNASTDLAGNKDDGGISLDWGVNAAALFGRQTARGHHSSAGYHISTHTHYGEAIGHSIYQRSASPDRSKNVVVPDVGGFAAISWFYPGAKVSIGYKADFFFNAIDGGIDARKETNRGFFGPYASISIGLGD